MFQEGLCPVQPHRAGLLIFCLLAVCKAVLLLPVLSSEAWLWKLCMERIDFLVSEGQEKSCMLPMSTEGKGNVAVARKSQPCFSTVLRRVNSFSTTGTLTSSHFITDCITLKQKSFQLGGNVGTKLFFLK